MQLTKQAGEGPFGLCVLPPTSGAGAVPSNVEPISVIQALSMQLQHPPALGNGPNAPAGAFTPRCQISGRPASSPQKMVVDVPSVIWSILTGETPFRTTLKFSTPSRSVCAPNGPGHRQNVRFWGSLQATAPS